jgi:arylsulfatase
MAAGWAVAFNTPFMWTKQVASSFGGTRVGMVAHWPQGIKAKGEVRNQFSHVIDVAPTILEAAGLPEPKVVNGTPQIPMEGSSLVYTFADAGAKERHTTQYFEISGNRGIYHDGWFAGTVHKAPWEAKPRRALQDDVWELYDVNKDFSLSRDLAAKNPEKLKELQALFLVEAQKYGVLPIDDRVFERALPELVGRPDLFAGRDSITLGDGMTGMLESAFIGVKNKSKTITADIEVPAAGGNGAIMVQGGRFGGWALYVKDGVPAYTYNLLGMRSETVTGNKPLTAGKHTVRMEFAYAGGGLGKGGGLTLFVDNVKVGEGSLTNTQPMMFSADETADVGIDLGTPVVEAVGAGEKSRFTGKIARVKIDLKP